MSSQAKFQKGDLVIVQPPLNGHPCNSRYRGLVGRIVKHEDIRDSFDRSLVVQYTLKWLDVPDTSNYWYVCGDPTNLIQEDWLVPITQAEYDTKIATLEAQKVKDFMEGMEETLRG